VDGGRTSKSASRKKKIMETAIPERRGTRSGEAEEKGERGKTGVPQWGKKAILSVGKRRNRGMVRPQTTPLKKR